MKEVNFMNITQEALAEIKKNAKYLKITVEIGGCNGFQYSLEYVNEVPADCFSFADVLVSDQESFNLMKGSILDFKRTLGYEEYTIKNPQAKTGCGCGNSFSL
jgi:iron-sulfur cluster insertion protein